MIQKTENEILVMNPAEIAENDSNLDLTNGQILHSDSDSVAFFAFANCIL